MHDRPPRIRAARIEDAWLTRPETQAVFAALRDAGFAARVVGGAVRNALIGKAASDIDIATPARPEQTIAAANAAGLDVIPTGLQHGTVTVLAGGISYEVTTLRRDVETDGRHAIVAFTDDWTADAARRDFTINALYCDADGTVHDPLSGYPDLEARRVRFIGDAEARIREDTLRILRFFRFTAEHATGAPDADGLAACGRMRSGLEHLSAERIRVELLKTVVAPRAADIATLMFQHGFWTSLLGLVVRPTQLQRMATTDVTHDAAADAVLRLAVLAVATPEDATRLAARLRLSNAEKHLLTAIAHLSPALSPGMPEAAVRRWLYAHGRVHLTAALRVADARHGGDWSRVRRAAETLAIPAFPLRGQDLLDAGVVAGPSVGAALKRAEHLWINSDFDIDRATLLGLIGATP